MGPLRVAAIEASTWRSKASVIGSSGAAHRVRSSQRTRAASRRSRIIRGSSQSSARRISPGGVVVPSPAVVGRGFSPDSPSRSKT